MSDYLFASLCAIAPTLASSQRIGEAINAAFQRHQLEAAAAAEPVAVVERIHAPRAVIVRRSAHRWQARRRRTRVRPTTMAPAATDDDGQPVPWPWPSIPREREAGDEIESRVPCVPLARVTRTGPATECRICGGNVTPAVETATGRTLLVDEYHRLEAVVAEHTEVACYLYALGAPYQADLVGEGSEYDYAVSFGRIYNNALRGRRWGAYRWRLDTEPVAALVAFMRDDVIVDDERLAALARSVARLLLHVAGVHADDVRELLRRAHLDTDVVEAAKEEPAIVDLVALMGGVGPVDDLLLLVDTCVLHLGNEAAARMPRPPLPPWPPPPPGVPPLPPDEPPLPPSVEPPPPPQSKSLDGDAVLKKLRAIRHRKLRSSDPVDVERGQLLERYLTKKSLLDEQEAAPRPNETPAETAERLHTTRVRRIASLAAMVARQMPTTASVEGRVKYFTQYVHGSLCAMATPDEPAESLERRAVNAFTSALIEIHREREAEIAYAASLRQKLDAEKGVL